MLLSALVRVSQEVAKTPKRLAKIAAMADCLARAEPEYWPLVAQYFAGELRQRKLGVGYAQLATMHDVAPESEPTLTIAQVDEAFEAIANVKGLGAQARRSELMRNLFARATADEQHFLARLIMGELRQGALESLLVDAIAKAAGVPVEAVRRAQMLAADLPTITRVAFAEGAPGLARFDLTLFRPVQPMLAETAEDVREALGQLGRAAFEVKLDGARVQVHRRGDEVRVYTRSLNEVTGAVPELVALTRSLPCNEAVFDGEVIALRPDGRPYPFQETMRRFGRKLDVAALEKNLPLSTFYFDCLYLDGQSLLDEPYETRVVALSEVVPEHARVLRRVTDSADEADAWFRDVLARGHEGLMAKDLRAPYVAGKRGASWLKLKHAHTLDLVVLAAEWGSGRRKGWLSNLHLGARDPKTGGFVMLGKTFKGLTDELLRFQTQELLARETHRDAYTVYVRPELVVEIALNDVQTSPHYPAGLALRFARVKRYRLDKTPAEADTIETVRTIHAKAHVE